jgi:hypothetical protein
VRWYASISGSTVGLTEGRASTKLEIRQSLGDVVTAENKTLAWQEQAIVDYPEVAECGRRGGSTGVSRRYF